MEMSALQHKNYEIYKFILLPPSPLSYPLHPFLQVFQTPLPSFRKVFPSMKSVLLVGLQVLGETKTVCKQFVTSFIDCTDLLRTQISPNVCNQILGTQQRPHLNQLQNFISNS